MLLTMKTKVLLPPPGVFQHADLYSRKRWRRVQYLANEFWLRWKKEFLQTLQQRPKWIPTNRNMKIDDIVIIKEESQPRNRWQLARIADTYPGDDGLVRKVKLAVPPKIDADGKRKSPVTFLDRPIHKLQYAICAQSILR
ncbi:hypothetical protein QZH41_004550 [Actinostola sp. cb2023]|nr:hypothetical protein QZH41_004550 [Actinostola sp. cb2023]